jgi:hypothetical protein
MIDLIKRLEALEAPCREAFDEAFVAIHGPKPPRVHGGSQEMTDWLGLYNPFLKMMDVGAWLDAAMTLVPEVLRRQVYTGYVDGVIAWAGLAGSDKKYAKELPIAICIAALRAREEI